MVNKILKYIFSIIIGVLIVGCATAVYMLSGNIMAAIGTGTFLYTVSKPIQDDLDKWTKPKEMLRVIAVYEDKDANFEKSINAKIDELTNGGKTIVGINVLSTKRAVIQYSEKLSKKSKKSKKTNT